MPSIVDKVLGMSAEESNSILNDILSSPRAKIEQVKEELLAKIAAIELQIPEKGEKGDRGEDGRDGKPGEFVQLVGKFLVGTATASQVINFVWQPIYGWE